MATVFGDRYELRGELGHGGMGVVHRAWDRRTGREVALKVLTPEAARDTGLRRRFEREAQTVAGLEHTAVVPLYDFGYEEGQPFLVMRLMSGGTLQDRLQRGRIDPPVLLRGLGRVASALDAAHAAGLVHRDIKPGNVLFDGFGDAFLSDFGIVFTPGTTLTGAVMVGTPLYISPEQIRASGPVGPASDVYSLGAVVFHGLIGKPPFNADNALALLGKHLGETPVVPPGVGLPEETVAVILRALAKEPGDRWQTAGAFLRALRASLDPGLGATAAASWATSAHPTTDEGAATVVDGSRGHLPNMPSVFTEPAAAGRSFVLAWEQSTILNSGVLAKALATPPKSHDTAINALAPARVEDRACVFTAGYDRRIVRWDLALGAPTGVALTGHRGGVYALRALLQPGCVVSGSHDGTVRIWHPESGRCKAELQAHRGVVRAIDASLLQERPVAVSGGFDGYLRAWDIDATERIYEVRAHSQMITSLAINRDTVASVGLDGRLAVRSLSDGEIRWEADMRGRLQLVAWAGDELVAAGQGASAIQVVGTDGKRQRTIAVEQGEIRAVTTHSWNGRNLLGVGTMESKVIIVDVDTGAMIDSLTIEGGQGIRDLEFVAEGRDLYLAAGDGTGMLRVWMLELT